MALGDIAPELRGSSEGGLAAASREGFASDQARAIEMIDGAAADITRQIEMNVPAELRGALLQELSQSVGSAKLSVTGMNGAMAISRALESIGAIRQTIGSQIEVARAVATSNAIYNSLSAAGQARVDARVAEQFDAIQEGDIVVIAKRFRSPIYDELPDEMQQRVDKSSEAILASPYGQETVGAMQKAMRENPRGSKRTLEKIEATKTLLEEMLLDEKDPQRRAFIQQFLKTNAYAMPAANEVAVRLVDGHSTMAELEKAAKPAYDQLSQSFVGNIPALRSHNAAELNDVMAAVSPEMRDRLQNDRELTRYLLTRARELAKKPEELQSSLLELYNHKGDTSKLTAHAREVLAVNTLMASTTANVTMVGALMQLGRAQELTRAVEGGVSLSADDMAHVEGLAFIKNPVNPLVQRSERLLQATLGGMEEAGTPFMRSVYKDQASNLARTSLTLAYIDRNGGLEKFQEFSQRLEAGNKSSKPDAEAVAYFAKYQNYLSQSLIGEAYNPDDQSQAAKMALAMRSTGQRLADGSLQIDDRAADIKFYKRDSNDFAPTSSAFESVQQLVTVAYGGTASIVKELYDSSRKDRANNPEFVAIARKFDTYRLQSDPSSEQMIKDLWLGQVPLAEIQAKLDIKIAQEREGMQEFSAYALSQAQPQGIEILAKYNMRNADGSVNVAALMDKIEANKVALYNKYDIDTLTRSLDAPIATLPKDLQEARALSELGTLMRSAHSLEHLTARLEPIERELDRLRTSGEKPSPRLLEDKALLTAILEYDSDTSSPAQKTAFDAAIREFMMRDAYVKAKEDADTKKTPEDRANLIENTIAVIKARLKDEPDYFRHVHHDEHAEVTVAVPTETPVASNPSLVTPIPSAEEVAALKSEGNKDGWDALFENTIEDRIKKALINPDTKKAMTRTEIADIFRNNVTGDLLGASNVGNKENISVNEIENALQEAANRQAGKALSSGEVVALFDTADANGKKDGQLSIDEIVAGLRANGQLATSVAGGQGSTVAAATSAAPAGVPQVTSTAGPAAPTTVVGR